MTGSQGQQPKSTAAWIYTGFMQGHLTLRQTIALGTKLDRESIHIGNIVKELKALLEKDGWL